MLLMVAVAVAESQDRQPGWDLLQPLFDIGVRLAEELEVQERGVEQHVHELRWKVRRLNPLPPPPRPVLNVLHPTTATPHF